MGKKDIGIRITADLGRRSFLGKLGIGMGLLASVATANAQTPTPSPKDGDTKADGRDPRPAIDGTNKADRYDRK